MAADLQIPFWWVLLWMLLPCYCWILWPKPVFTCLLHASDTLCSISCVVIYTEPVGGTVNKITHLLFSHAVWKVERKWQDSHLYVSLCNVSMKKPFHSKATGSKGVFYWVSHGVPSTKPGVTAVPKQCELKKCQGNGKVWKGVCCALSGVWEYD